MTGGAESPGLADTQSESRDSRDWWDWRLWALGCGRLDWKDRSGEQWVRKGPGEEESSGSSDEGRA